MGKPRTRSSSWLTPWAIADPAKDLIAVTRSNDGLDVSWCEAFECGASRFQTALLTLHREASLHTQLKLYCQKINALFIWWLKPCFECLSNTCYDWLYLINPAPQINHPVNNSDNDGKRWNWTICTWRQEDTRSQYSPSGSLVSNIPVVHRRISGHSW